MPKLWWKIKDWIPASVAVVLLIVATIFAFARQSHVAAGIRAVGKIGLELDASTRSATGMVMTPDEITAVNARAVELEQRINESSKPALLVPVLSEAARKTGLVVLEIQPVSLGPAQGDKNETGGARYRVIVEGSYEQIAEYMEGCKTLRLPVRVIGLRIAPANTVERSEGGLKAELSVEAIHVESGANSPAA